MAYSSDSSSSNRINGFFESQLSKAREASIEKQQSIRNEVKYWNLIHSKVAAELLLLEFDRGEVIHQSEDTVGMYVPIIVKELRNRFRWSQSELADRVGKLFSRHVDKTFISRLENQKKNQVSIVLLEILCRVFGVQLSELVRYAEDLLIFECLPTKSQSKIMKSIVKRLEVVSENTLNH